MGRRRTTSDSQILEAALRVMSRVSPQQFTLADIAAEAGLAPPTLLQRFGSKRGLLLALARAGAEGTEGCFDAARARHRSPLNALFASLRQAAQLAASPEALANNLGFLQNDMADPEFRHYTRIQLRAMLDGYRGLLDDAVSAGELAPCETRALARLLQSVVHGSLVAWGFEQQGSAAAWLLRDVRALLKPWRLAAAPRSISRARPSRR